MGHVCFAFVVQDKNFPPEVISVIPAIVQSSLKVYSKAQELLTGEGRAGSQEDDEESSFLGHAPNLRDVFRVVDGCSKIPKVCVVEFPPNVGSLPHLFFCRRTRRTRSCSPP